MGSEMCIRDRYGDTTRVPLFDREFLGGLYSLRGFRFRDIGPKDLTGAPIGGRTSWFASAEYSVPIIERFRFAIFYDVGMVSQQAFSFSTDYSYTDSRGNLSRGNTGTYNDNIGIGMRLNLPIGPLRLDYGIPLTSDPDNNSSGRFNFGVGWERPF